MIPLFLGVDVGAGYDVVVARLAQSTNELAAETVDPGMQACRSSETTCSRAVSSLSRSVKSSRANERGPGGYSRVPFSCSTISFGKVSSTASKATRRVPSSRTTHRVAGQRRRLRDFCSGPLPGWSSSADRVTGAATEQQRGRCRPRLRTSLAGQVCPRLFGRPRTVALLRGPGWSRAGRPSLR